MDYIVGKNTSDLFFTDYGTIIGKNFTEILVNDFFKKIERNIESDSYDVFYDKKNNAFIVTFDGKNYVLNLDKKIMEEYVLGNYTEITRKLDLLMKKERQVRNDEQIKKEKQESERLEKEQMIELAKSGVISNDTVRKVYIDYLKKSIKPSFENLNEYFDNISEDFGSIKENFIVDMLKDVIIEISDGYVKKILIGVVVDRVLRVILALLSMVLPKLAIILYCLVVVGRFSYFILPYILLVSSYLIGYPMKRIKRLIKYIKNKRLIKQKIKNLSSVTMINENQIKSTASRQLDEIEEKDIVIESIPSDLVVLNEINKIAERLKYINIVDGKRLGKKLRELLKEFMLRFNELEKRSNSNTSILQVSNDKTNLNMEMLIRISDIERELLEIRKRDLEDEQNKKSVEIIDQKIESATTTLYTEGYNDDLSSGGVAYTKK